MSRVSQIEAPLAAGAVPLLNRWWRSSLILALIMLGGFLVAVEFRLRLAIGSTLGADYVAQPLAAFGLTVLGSTVGGLTAALLDSLPARRRLLLGLITGVTVTFFTITFLIPLLSLLQVFYFVVLTLLLGVITILLPSQSAPPNVLQNLWRQRALLLLWTRYNILSRYQQAFLGMLWIVLLPLSTAAIFAFVFSRILRIAPEGVPYLAFFLTGITFWNVFSQGIIAGTASVLSKLSLISQVYFPRELLLLINLGEIFVDFSFSFAALLVLNLFQGIVPNANFAYLPLLLIIQTAMTLGLMFFISPLSVMIRDIPQLVNVLLQIAFYLTPIIYAIDTLPDDLRSIVVLNPMSTLIAAYRDIILYNRAPDMISLYYPLVMSFTLLYLGYRFFKAHEQQLADYI